MITAKVIVDISTSNVDKVFDYTIPDGMNLCVGYRVLVPFGNKTIEGFCIEISECVNTQYTLKPITSLLDSKPLITEEMIKLMHYMKSAFYVRYVDCLRLFIPAKLRGGRVKELEKEYVTLSNSLTRDEMLSIIGKRAKSQCKIVEEIPFDGEFVGVLNSEYGAQAVKALIDKGILIKNKKTVYRKPFKEIDGVRKSVKLTNEQENALKLIMNGDNPVSLLHGVTGSGKTEVYLRAIDNVLADGKTAIMLVPEISLTPQMLGIFRSRYGDGVAMLHSGLSDGERYDEWRRLHDGSVKVALGARSAIFAPLQNVGLIIVDEEHDQSYISENNPRFNAIEIAIFRANYNRAKLVLGSATPSIESYRKAQNGEYQLITMAKRIADYGLPEILVVDMARELMSGNFGIFATQLKDNVVEEVKKGNQVIIFLNRRGYASFMMCKECGYIAKCTDCDVPLTLHSDENMLKCHYCNKRFKPLTQCPVCASTKIRHGKVGTEQVVEELQTLLPDVKILRLDNDTTTTKAAYREILGAFRRKEAQILVGTQMIAKGHDFPDVTLVGVLDADMSLYYSNYMSNEKTFQLITQVAGRAGRADKAGKVIIQTYSPKHFVFNYIRQNNYKGFYEKEINTRELSKFPPFTTIVRVLVRSETEQIAIDCTKKIFSGIKTIASAHKKDFIYFQAMKAPLARIERKHRYQIIMRIARNNENEIIRLIYALVDDNQVNNASIFVELNPSDMR